MSIHYVFFPPEEHPGSHRPNFFVWDHGSLPNMPHVFTESDVCQSLSPAASGPRRCRDYFPSHAIPRDQSPSKPEETREARRTWAGPFRPIRVQSRFMDPWCKGEIESASWGKAVPPSPLLTKTWGPATSWGGRSWAAKLRGTPFWRRAVEISP